MVLHPTTSVEGTKKLFQNLPEEVQTCIQRCMECHQICEQVMFHCLQKEGDHSHDADHVRLLHDCAEICAISANFLMRDSTFHHRTCEICAEICQTCAEDCEDFPEDDAMATCATSCRACADSCRQLSSSH